MSADIGYKTDGNFKFLDDIGPKEFRVLNDSATQYFA
jgi:hypothetical protein